MNFKEFVLKDIAEAFRYFVDATYNLILEEGYIFKFDKIKEINNNPVLLSYDESIDVDTIFLASFAYVVQNGLNIENIQIDNVSFRLVHQSKQRHQETFETIFEAFEDEASLGFIKIIGYYTTWNGADWSEDIIPVAPHEKLITVYRDL